MGAESTETVPHARAHRHRPHGQARGRGRQHGPAWRELEGGLAGSGRRPEAALDVLGLFLAKARKRRPKEKLLTAYTYVLGQALESARLAAEGGLTFGAEVTDAVRHRALGAGNNGQIELALL